MKLLSVIGATASLSLFAVAQSNVTGSADNKGDSPSHSTAHAGKNTPCIHFAKDLIGMKVVNPEGEKIGKIEDIVVRPSGDVAYAVLSFGGVMGVGEKLFAMPWTVLTSSVPGVSKTEASDSLNKDDSLTLVLPLDKERMKKAPGFDKTNWPVMASADWAKDIDAYYAKDRGVVADRPADAGTQVSQITWRCTELKGFGVKTPAGEKLGDVKELAIDTNGRVNYVVLSVGGFLGMGDRLVAVPWDALKFSVENEKGDKTDKRKIVLTITKDQLERAPQFNDSKDKLPEMCDPTWMTRMYEFYAVRPYWTQA